MHAAGNAIHGGYIQQLADSAPDTRDAEVDRHIELLQRLNMGDHHGHDADGTFKQNAKAIQSRGLVKRAIVWFARTLGDACTISPPHATNVEPPEWEVQVVEAHKKSDGKYYYTICTCCTSNTPGAATTKYEVHRRWSELQGFLDRTKLKALARASSKDLEKILGQDGVSTGMPPGPPKGRDRSSTAADRVEHLQTYFKEWNAWNEALRREHGFSITELRCVWDYLSKQ
jgi:hypothetical protein